MSILHELVAFIECKRKRIGIALADSLEEKVYLCLS